MRTTLLALSLVAGAAATAWAQVDPGLLSSMKARSIGPAGMSGRVSAVDVVERDPNIIYLGSATGGVWKSVDRGLTWKPIFDDQPVSSIGDVAVFQAAPDIVWVGTGEGNVRNSAGVGNGIYKSMDGGETWEHLGLERSERIHRVVLHPTDPAIAYLAVLGPTWSDGAERGVYKTTDGGKTWDRVLYVNERTGAADLIMDPGNPNKLFVALWEHRRWPWFFTSGGPGSGLYVTHDAGETWKQLTEEDGLPKGELGRSGIAIARNDPNVVYALVEAEKSALLRSDDGGQSWRTVNDSRGINPRPFYYADIRVDPLNENRIYSLHSRITVSEDAGKNFATVVPSSIIHGDVHELWIHPEDSRFLIMGNDGGIGISFDRGENWRFVENLPLAQFYHLNLDMATPFNVYGGLQDNGSWFGPSSVWMSGGIRNVHWTRVGSGDGFATMADFGDPRWGYSMSQQGRLNRFDRVTGIRKEIQPVHPDGENLRFNWNAAINVDPMDSTTIYFGSQFVHKTTDRGETWTVISPDLTTNDPEKQRYSESGGITRDATGAENHTTIMTIAPSPVEEGVIWVGTDDGNVQLTVDGGTTWANVVNRIEGVPQNTWVPHIEPSKFHGGSAFVVFDDHRRGNWTSYLFVTEDYGRSWRSLANNGLVGFLHTVEQDPMVPYLLYAGSEFGLFMSLDGGESWFKWTHGTPTAPYRALMVHPRDHDLAMGTHGRGVYILDDVRPLRALATDPSMAMSPVLLFEPPPAIQYAIAEAIGYRSTGHSMFFGENRAYGALLSFWVGDSTASTATIEIAVGDEVVRTVEQEVHIGLNRFVWNLRSDGFKTLTSSGTSTGMATPVLPGDYSVRVIVREDTAEGTLRVDPDPRLEVPMRGRELKATAMLRVGQRTEVATEAVERIRATKKGLEAGLAALGEREDSASQELVVAGEALGMKLDSLAALFVNPPGAGPGGDPPVSSQLSRVYFSLQTSWDAPTEAQRLRLERAESELENALAELNDVFSGEVAVFRRQLVRAGLDVIPDVEELDIDWTGEVG
ncbi:MAG: hypothetical protein JSW51_00830 [Gemmatimonadota bacterium]|nr:MAG: hypothetical protein JSW51_00830 [Gemmatimonadota bacterium]